MLRLTKVSAAALIFYILFYVEIWGDNHLILYGTAAVTMLSMLIHWLRTESIAFKRVPYGIWNNLVLVVYAVVSGFFVTPDYMTTFRMSMTILAFSAICVAICYAAAEENSFEWILKVFIALALLCSAYTLLFGTPYQNYGITMSVNNNPHTLAAVLFLGEFSVIYLARDREKKLSLISAALIFLFLIIIIRCGSRKYLVASAMIVGIWTWAVVREGWKSEDSNRRAVTWLVLLAVIVVAYYIVTHFYLGSDSQLRMQNSDDQGNKYRILFYEESWKIFLNYPVFGAGMNQFKNLSTVVKGIFSHSTYAEALADLGFVGCVLYFTPIISASYRILVRAIRPGRKYSDYLLLAFCLAELFIGSAQVFFMEFHHFLIWSVLFFYDLQDREPLPGNLPIAQMSGIGKYIHQRRPVIGSVPGNLTAQGIPGTGKYIRRSRSGMEPVPGNLTTQGIPGTGRYIRRSQPGTGPVPGNLTAQQMPSTGKYIR